MDYVSYKEQFKNIDNYNQLNLLNISLYHHLIIIHTELQQWKSDIDISQHKYLINDFLNLYEKYNKYDFCQDHFNLTYDNEDIILLKDASIVELFQFFFDKINLIMSNFMERIEYEPRRVSYKHKTSIILIAYATELKALWDAFDDDYIENVQKELSSHELIYRNEFMEEKLRYNPPPTAKGAWKVKLSI